MLKRQILVVLTVAMLLVVGGCTAAGGVETPDREVPISVESALEAQNLAMNGLMAGQVEWTEGQFSSLLTELLKANSGENSPIETITAWFEPGTLYLRVELIEGVLPATFGNTLELAGSLEIVDNYLVLDIQEAAAGNYAVSGDALAPVNAQINAALANQPLGVPVDVEIGAGTLMLSMAQ